MTDAAPAMLLAIDRAEAKSLFAARGEDLVRLVGDLAADANLRDSGMVVELNGDWRRLAAGLCELADEKDPLAAAREAINAGRVVLDDDNHLITLVRPDMPPHIVAALKLIDPGELAQPIGAMLPTVTQLYTKAAATHRAVVFASKVKD